MSNVGLNFRDSWDEYDGRAELRAPGLTATAPVNTEAYTPRRPAPYDSGRTRIDSQGRRTVRISGQPTPARRRPAIDVNRYNSSPDRAALWALILGVFMVVVAIATGS